MGKLREEAEEAIEKYGKEAFLNHRNEVYHAIEVVCFCLECLQNQEDWGGKRAIPLKANYYSQEEWEKIFSEQYDHDIRRVELMKLRMELDEDDDIPLKNFLFQGLDLMINGLWYDPESWMQLMETQIMTDQYTNYRAFLEAVYVLGLLDVWNLQLGIGCHFFRGDFRDAEHFLKSFASQVPEKEQEDYKAFCAETEETIRKYRRDDMKEILKERDRRLKNMQEEKGGIPVLERFDKSMGEMSDEDFKKFVAAQLKKIEDELEMAEEEACESMEILQDKRKAEIRSSVEKVMGRATQERNYTWV